jgi:Outer membrane protein beta-barrel domain
MQSVRLKNFLTLPRIGYWRSFSSLSFFILVSLLTCQAQDTQPAAPKLKFDAGVGGFYQVTNAANGNFIRDDTTESGGVLISVRQPYRPWLGWEANFGYTKFYEAYNKGNVKIENNVTDVSFSYLFQAPTVYGVQPYASVGGGVIVFSPIQGTLTNLLSPVQSLPSQLVPEFAYNFGLNYPVFSRLGVRGGLRGLMYKTPDFHQQYINTQTLRTTLEPNLTIYYRF